MSLRDDAVEAMAKAFVGTYRDYETREYLQSPWQGDVEDMEAALDALLDCLEANAHEWTPAWFRHADEVGFLGSLLAVLRETPQGET